jgi:hypothetical protein
MSAIIIFVLPFIALVIIGIFYDRIIPPLFRHKEKVEETGWYKILKAYYFWSIIFLFVGVTYFSNNDPTALTALICGILYLSGIIYIHVHVAKSEQKKNDKPEI